MSVHFSLSASSKSNLSRIGVDFHIDVQGISKGKLEKEKILSACFGGVDDLSFTKWKSFS